MKRVKAGPAWLLGLGVGLGIALSSQAADFDPATHPGAAALVETLAAREVPAAWASERLKEAVFRQEVLDAMAGAAERRLRWDEYRAIFMQPERIARGVDFIAAHREAFERAEARYGVPPEIIAAIIGVETRYGEVTGRHRVLDSLATLGFHHPRRGDFFRGELAAFLEITHEQGVEPGEMRGSYAGAMGYPQFIPTSYRAYAVDFDDDGLRDLWTNPVDAIGSVGNYFAEHGWRPGEAIYVEAEGPMALPDGIDFNQTRPPYADLASLAAAGIEPRQDEPDPAARVIPLALDALDDAGEVSYRYRLGQHNFYVITRYNHSHLYAMAVTELAEAIAAAREAQS
ncbi:soluble lytic transglycosylase B [Bisbaumannia pacifica]|uniref:Soluble lytic transglycosylase B n=1 Tax=Bisbaumannia pacifica TaxID=77098 RepID=A0A510XAT0_9GAMM|nr:lytic murein transglycosylase B [Halomonas pacifica]GEK48131.1 soluble lytic transglycosylase B [Halomonas pacifica]